MKIRRSAQLLLVLTVAACGDPAGPGDDVASVVLSPEDTAVDVGLTVQFSAQALDATGAAVSGVTVTWASSNETIATIDANGLATALAVGVTSITASAGGQNDSHVLTVQPNECTGRIDVILGSGEFQAYDADECLLLPAGQSGDQYRVAVMRPNDVSDSTDVPTVTLEINPILTTAAAPVTVPPQVASGSSRFAASGRSSLAGGIDGTKFVEDQRRLEATRAFHYELRQKEIEEGLHLKEAVPAGPARGPARTNHPDPPQRDDLFLDLECTGAVPSPVQLIHFNDQLAIYQDSVQWAAGPLTVASATQMLAYYANHAEQMIIDYFGDPSDLDGNERVIVVTTPAIPEGAAAAVFSGDFLTTASCPGSNEGEVIYFAEDVIKDLDSSDPSYISLGVLAHEMKHVVSLYHSVQRRSFQPTWMEEGRAEIAQTMSSRIAWAATGGPAVGAKITGADIINFVNNQGGGDPTPEMWAIVGQLADVIVAFSTQPNSLTVNPTGSHENHTFYASSWHFHRFIGDIYGNASTPQADAPTFNQLEASGSPSGNSGLASATGRTFFQLFDEVAVGMSVHETVASASPTFTTWDLESSTDIFTAPPVVAPDGLYPWPVTQSGATSAAPYATASFTGSMGVNGIRFHDFVSNGQGQGAQIQVTGAGTSGRIIVTRIN